MAQSDIGRYIESVTPDWPECLDFHQRTIEALDITLKRAEAAEARADLAEARIIELQARIDMLELEVMQQHHIAAACAEDERLEAKRYQLRAKLEKIRSEALDRFNSADKDHTQ